MEQSSGGSNPPFRTKTSVIKLAVVVGIFAVLTVLQCVDVRVYWSVFPPDAPNGAVMALTAARAEEKVHVLNTRQTGSSSGKENLTYHRA